MPASPIIKTIIAEAAGEGDEGMYMVASAIATRALRRKLTPEQVVNQPKQFSGRWRRDLDRFVAQQGPEVLARAERAWQRAQTQPMPGVDHYLTTTLYRSPKRPAWASTMRPIGQVGRHTIFDSQRKGAPMPEETAPTPQEIIKTNLQRLDRMTRGFERGLGLPAQGFSLEELRQARVYAEREAQAAMALKQQGRLPARQRRTP